MYDFKQLLIVYCSLWQNRPIPKEDLNKHNLYRLIKSELLDESTHPRVRNTVERKFYYATKRIMNSNLTRQDKIHLIEIHVEIMESIFKKADV